MTSTEGFGSPGPKLPEAFYLAARWCREAVADGLRRLVAARAVDETTAVGWAGMLLAGNGRHLYRA